MAQTATDALEVVLQHVTSKQQHPQTQQQQQQQQSRRIWKEPRVVQPALPDRDYKTPLSRLTVRALHPISRRLCSAARATRTHISLGAYSKWTLDAARVQSRAQGTPAEAKAAPEDSRWGVPWQLLAAAPAVTTLQVELQQLPALLTGAPQVLADLTQRLTALEVAGCWREYARSASASDDSSGSIFQAQLQCLGRLLDQCSGVKVLCVSGNVKEVDAPLLEAALVAGPASNNPAAGPSSSSVIQLSSSSSSSGRSGIGLSASGISSRVGTAVAHNIQELQLDGVPVQPFLTWLQQKGHLSRLPCLVLNNLQPASWEASFDCLTGLAGLQQLQLGFNMPGNYFLANAAPLPPGLTAVTQLSITGVTTDDVFGPTLSTMTQLRSLRLSQPEDFQEELLDCSWVTALKELRHLDLSSCWLWELPEDLGEALPALEVLLVAGCRMQEPLPSGMTRLTQLDASKNPGLRSAGLDTVCEATALRRLNLSGSHDMDTACLSALSQLEVLELRDCGPRPKDAEEQEGRHSSGSERDSVWQPPTLPHLVNLRHLDLGKGDWWVSDLVPMGGLQQLTYLNLSHGLGAHHHRKDAVSLPSLGVLPALQRLDLSHVSIKGNHWPPVGAWLGQQPQLTQLFLQHSGKLRRRRRGGREPAWEDVMYQTQGLAQLPTQLVELNLRHCSLQDLPACLSRLTNLQVLLAGAGNSYTTRALPAWVTLLQQLEVLEVEKVDPPMGEAAAALLARLPRLREFRLDDIWCVDDHKYLFRRLPHLSGLS